MLVIVHSGEGGREDAERRKHGISFSVSFSKLLVDSSDPVSSGFIFSTVFFHLSHILSVLMATETQGTDLGNSYVKDLVT